MKVLIVDDEPSIVNLIRMNLKLEGYDSVCAYSGREAVEAYAAQKPDIVLLDIMLPDMDGYDVLRAIQELDRRHLYHRKRQAHQQNPGAGAGG